jgi:hypothetical protein
MPCQTLACTVLLALPLSCHLLAPNDLADAQLEMDRHMHTARTGPSAADFVASAPSCAHSNRKCWPKCRSTLPLGLISDMQQLIDVGS